METIAVPIMTVLFVWWFSTGAVLMLVGAAARYPFAAKLFTATLLFASLAGLVETSRTDTPLSIYAGFTWAILLWGAVETAFLAGWITGPRPLPCPPQGDRLFFALQAIAYHELLLIVTGSAAIVLTHDAANTVGLWTLVVLLVLRQSAKINLFLGVRTLNDELLPKPVAHLKTYFARGQINALFPVSVTGATAAAVILALAARSATSQPDTLALSLLATLVALGALEHWFMVLPLPVAELWRWSAGETSPDASKPPAERPVLSVIAGGARTVSASIHVAAAAPCSARQRLEQQFRDTYWANKRTNDAPLVPHTTAVETIAEGRVS